MYLFLILGIPLAFALLAVYAYPRDEFPAMKKALGLGLLSFVPLWIVARILGSMVPASYGTILLAFHEWADRILPYSVLPALAYRVFYHANESLPHGTYSRRFTAFYAGTLAPVGICETFRIWGSPDPYVLFLLPIILAAACVLMPQLVGIVYESFGRDRVIILILAGLGSLIVALVPFLLLIHLGIVGILVIAAVAALVWFRYYPELEARSPVSFSE